jgi:hypothetical protein
MRHEAKQSGRYQTMVVGFLILSMGVGMLLRTSPNGDLVFPVGGGIFALIGIGVLIASTRLRPSEPTPGPYQRFGLFFGSGMALLSLGFIALSASERFNIKWLGIVGIVLNLPFIAVCIWLFGWIVPRGVREMASKRRDT